jgi:hypothetical protein
MVTASGQNTDNSRLGKPNSFQNSRRIAGQREEASRTYREVDRVPGRESKKGRGALASHLHPGLQTLKVYHCSIVFNFDRTP